jgi:hypothetical protein
MSTVIDYAWGRPSIAALKAHGAVAVCRYLAYPQLSTQGKLLTRDEATGLAAAGIAIVSNWEHAGSWTAEYSGGYATGLRHATEAARQHAACGGPPDRPIYFSADFDPTDAQLPTIAHYYQGVADVIGLARTGAYGGYRTVKYLLDRGVIRWAWQTYAWSKFRDSPDQASYLHWDPRAQLRQIKNEVYIDGVSCDLNESMTADFGQWGVETVMGDPYRADNADAHGYAITQRQKEYQVHAAGTDPGLTTIPNRLAPLLDKLEHFLDNPPAPAPVALTDAQVDALGARIGAVLAETLDEARSAIEAQTAALERLLAAVKAAAQASA